MDKILHLDCSTGVSGDMVVAALLDAGASQDRLMEVLTSLPLEGFSVQVGRTQDGAVDACDFDVVVEGPEMGLDHDMAYLFGDEGDETGDEGDGHTQGQLHTHRGLTEVLAVIDASCASQGAKDWARRIFHILAQAEAQVHGITLDGVRFHEVGAVDSIVDVLSAGVCLDDLGIAGGSVTPLYEGTGTVRTAHGRLPVPVPAVARIVADHGLTLQAGTRKGEFVTPTGAAIAAALAERGPGLPEHYAVDRLGYGAGKRAYEPRSLVRAMVVHEVRDQAQAQPQPQPTPDCKDLPADAKGAVWKLECDVDDCTGEALGHVIDRLMSAGAREAHALPLVMKKGRPGVQVQVICDDASRQGLERILFEDTTTIGIRRARMERTVLSRRKACVQTDHGSVEVKVVTLPGGGGRAYPEYDSVVRLAQESGIAYQDAYAQALAACSRLFGIR